MDCSPRLADTMQPLHCGDKNYAALQQSPLMKQNLTADPVNGADECSFGSNRIRVFGPSTGSDKSSIACEKKPPYHVATYEIDPEWVRQGRIKYQNDLRLYDQCMREQDWPGLPNITRVLPLPGYAKFNPIP